MASVKQRPEGTWRARYRDAAGKECAKHFAKKADAQRWLDQVNASIITGSYVAPGRGKLSVGTWAETWLAGKVKLKPSTRATYQSIVDHHVKPRWGNVALAKVAHEDVAEWVGEIFADGLSASRTRQVFTVFAQMLDAAVRSNRLTANPARGVELPALPAADHRYLTHAEVDALAEACGEYATLIRLLAYGGLRYGEAAALRAKRVDVLRGRVTISESVTEVGGKVTFTTPKTKKARTITVPRSVADALGVELAGKAPEDLVFVTRRGGVLREGNWRRDVFDDAAKSVGLDGLTPHALRHTAASLAISAGAHVVAVSRLLGHASPNVTLAVYSHLFENDLDDVAARLDDAAEISRTSRGLEVVSLDSKRAGRMC
jgi:integrase